MPVCPNCGNQAAENAIFCDQCGTRLPAAVEAAVETAVAPEVESTPGGVPEGVLICPSCGAENVPGEVFCDACGEPLEAPEPVPSEAVPEPEVAAVVEAEVVVEAVPEGEPEVEMETVLEAAAEPAGEPVAAAEGTYCPVCGASVRSGDTFCGTCGASLSAAAEEQAIAEEPVFAVAAESEEAVLVEEEPVPETVIAVESAVEGMVLEAEAPVEEELVLEEQPVEEPALQAEAEVAPAAEQPETCPVCGANVVVGQRFCASCGAALPVAAEAVSEPAPAPMPAPAPAAIPAEEPVAAPPTAGPYLEVADSGAHIPLVDQPELLIGRTDDISGIYPDVDMTPHGGEEGGVSRRHAQLVHEGDSWYVVDLDSTNGTYVNGTEIAPQVRVPIQDGDRIGFGDAELVFHAS
jgi:predicted amidophosphoribosyltransferase